MKKLFSGQAGFSMVEIMVAIGMLSVVSLGVMKLNENMFKSQKSIEQRATLADFRNRLIRTFSNQASCTATLAGLNPVVGANFNQIMSMSEDGVTGAPIFNTTPNDPLNQFGVGGSGYMKIQSFRVQGFDLTAGNAFNGLTDPADILSLEARMSGNARVVVQLRKPIDGLRNSYGNDNLSFGIDVTVVIRNIAGNNTIVTCYADSNQFVMAMCSSLGGTYEETDGRCKGTNILARNQIADDDELPFPVGSTFSMTAEQGIHAIGGVFIGSGLVGPIVMPGLRPSYDGHNPVALANRGLGVNTLIPPEGEIDSSSHIHSGANIRAGTSTANLGGVGNISAQNHIHADQSINAGINAPSATGTINANYLLHSLGNTLPAAVPDAFLPGIAPTFGSVTTVRPSILAGQGDIVVTNGKIVANQAVLRNCRGSDYGPLGVPGTGGGVVISDEFGNLSCRRGQLATCGNTLSGAGNRYTEIRAMVGYDHNGAPVCRKIMTYDNRACNTSVQTAADNYNASNSVMVGMTITTNAAGEVASTPNCCVKGSGCPSIGNVCANGYQAEQDSCGFTCPGSKPNLPVSGPPEQLVYGCEQSNDTNKVVRNFPEWTCGVPEDGNAMASTPRPCYLNGESRYHTFQECRDAGGEVSFFSKTNPQTCITFWGIEFCYTTGIAATNGLETDSFCMLPQQNASTTSGRITSQIRDSCSNCGAAITTTETDISNARRCRSGWTAAYNEADQLVYEVQPGFSCDAYGLAEIGACTTAPTAEWPPSKTYTFTGGVYYTDKDDVPARWPMSYIYAADNTEKAHVNYGSCPAQACDTMTRSHGSGCLDGANNDHHWAAFSCYAPISGISCK